MTKKKIRYSDFPVAAETAPAPDAVAAVPARPRAPVDLARALAAARATEEAAAAAKVTAPSAPVAAPVHVMEMRLTPVRGTAIIPRLTPVRGSIAIPRDVAHAPVAPTSSHQPALRDRARLRSGRVDLLLFCVGLEWFGVELAVVEEAIDLPAIRHVPEMPPAMLGVITVRGALASVYSPASALGINLGAPSSALIFRRPRGRLGIAVDDVDDVHTLDLAQLRDAPASDTGDGILLGVLRHRDTLLALVDAEALIAACQTVPALETA